MSKTAEIYDRIAARAAERGLTLRSVSLDATGRAETITTIRRGHMPNADRLEAIARVLETDVHWLVTGEQRKPVLADGREFFRHRELPRDVPVYGTAMGADLDVGDGEELGDVEVTNVFMTEVITYFARPPAVPPGSKLYGLYTVGESMEPRYRHGDPLFVDTRRPPAIGDDVIVQLVDKDEARVTAALIKTLVRRTAQFVELRQYNPDRTFRVNTAKVASIHRVMTVADLLAI